jgi:hypothetical protein
MPRFFERINSDQKAKVLILSNIHTSTESLETREKLTELAKQRKVIFLDEALSISTPHLSDFIFSLDNCIVKLYTGTIYTIGILDNDFHNITAKKYVEARIMKSEQKIYDSSLFIICTLLSTFKQICVTCNSVEIKHQISKELSYSEIICVEGYLDKLHEDINRLSIKFYTSPKDLAIFTDVVAAIFRLKDRLLDLCRAFREITSKRLSNQFPEYQCVFEQIENISDYKLQANLAEGVRNLFMAKRIFSVMKTLNRDIIVMVGLHHTIDQKNNFERSIQTILKEDFFVDEKNITLKHIDAGFDIDTYLGLELTNIKIQPGHNSI